ncbi:MAG: ComF family protein [Litorilinea sp.]
MGTLATTLNALMHAGLDFIFPPACASCQTLGWDLCPTCAQAVEPMPATICAHCGRVSPRAIVQCPLCRAGAFHALEMIRSAALFHSTLRAAIHAFKYTGQTALAAPLARYLVTIYAQAPWRDLPHPIDAVVPVPLHATRLAQRGYNQSELLAHAFSRQMALPLAPHWIERVRWTRQQVGLDVAARQANVAAAFVATPAVQGKTILLLDDVFTTGATLQACAQAARLAGARQVYGITLAAALGTQADTQSDPNMRAGAPRF